MKKGVDEMMAGGLLVLPEITMMQRPPPPSRPLPLRPSPPLPFYLSLSLPPHCPVGTLLWKISHSSLRPAFHAHVLPFLYWPPWRYSSFSCPPLGLPWSYSVGLSKTHSWPQALLSLSSHFDGQEGALKQTELLAPRGDRGDCGGS